MIRPEDVVFTSEDPLYRGGGCNLEYLGYGSYAEVKTDNGPLLKVLTGKETRLALGTRVDSPSRNPP